VAIFPKLDLPVLYFAHPYGGFTPVQTETLFAKEYIIVLDDGACGRQCGMLILLAKFIFIPNLALSN
jgi:hypothetical protein